MGDRRFRRQAPVNPKPAISIAHCDGSGTASVTPGEKVTRYAVGVLTLRYAISPKSHPLFGFVAVNWRKFDPHSTLLTNVAELQPEARPQRSIPFCLVA